MCTVTATTAAGAQTPVAAKKVTLKIATKGQKQILKKKAIKVKVKGLASGKLKLKGKSRTFDDPKYRKLTKKKTVRAPKGKKSKASAKLKLTKAGKQAIKSCEAREIKVSGSGAKAKAELKRNNAKCKPQPIDLSRADSCNFIGDQAQALCLMPFPDDYYTVADGSAATGRRVALKDSGMPQNASGTPIAAAPYNLNDGFSPGQAITLKVPGLDTPAALAATNPIPLNDLSRNEAQAPDEPVVVIDATTGQRHPIWVEIDSNAESADRTALLVHPATNFAAGHRYIVAMRNLKDASGATLAAPEGFRYYRDDLPSNEAAINAQRDRFESIFATLRDAGIQRSDLHLAWDFTVASDENIAARALHIRDDAFAELGDTNLADLTVQGDSPSFGIGTVTEFNTCGGDGCQAGESDTVERRIQGTFTVPCYLEPNCLPGGRFVLGPDGLPSQNGTYEANLDCIVPRAALDTEGAAAGSRPTLYGHGLLGAASEVFSSAQRTLAQTHGFVTCATDEIGFSANDIPNTIGILTNLGDFPELTDRVQQGLLNEMYLGRLMIHPDGFVSDVAFHVDGTTLGSPSTIDTSRLYYNGNSQGGILGGALTALAPDYTRASLGVPAMNYSVLLNRSIDFDLYATILDPAYPDELAQPLALSLIQMLWDRSDANGYAHRMTDDPLPNTPPHEVLMNVAFGDHQVTTWQADAEARTIGAQAHEPVVYDGRWPGVDILWGIPRIASYPYQGSAIVYWDTGPARPDPDDPGEEIGTDPPPIENVPNRTGEDPHSSPRRTPAEQQMVSDFLRPNALSSISDTCLGMPCFADGFTP
jgi:hypothetical protein